MLTKCRGGLRVYPDSVYLVGVTVSMLLLAVRDDVDGHSSHLTSLPVHLFAVLTVFLVSVSRQCRATTFLAKGDNRVGLR